MSEFRDPIVNTLVLGFALLFLAVTMAAVNQSDAAIMCFLVFLVYSIFMLGLWKGITLSMNAVDDAMDEVFK